MGEQAFDENLHIFNHEKQRPLPEFVDRPYRKVPRSLDLSNHLTYTYAVRALPDGAGIAWILVAAGLPAVIISPWAGPWIDGLDQRRLLIEGNLLLAGVTMILFFTVYHGQHAILALILIVLLGAGNVFPGISDTALTAQMVSREHLPLMD